MHLKRLKSGLFLTLSSSLSILSAQTWIPVGNGLNYGGYVNTLFVYDSVLYAGGFFTSPGNNIAQWNGTKWDTLGSGINNEVSAIAAYNGNVYFGGWFSKAGGHSAGSIGQWNGTTLSSAPFGVEDGVVNAMQVYNGQLYVGGSYDTVNHNYLTSAGLFSWNDTTVSPVSADTFYTNVYCLSAYKGNLYLGQEIYGPYDYCLADWNNLYFNCAGGYFHSSFYGYQYAMAANNTSFYLGGTFDTAGNIPANNVAQWNDTIWTNLGSGINGTVFTLLCYDSVLIAGGSFDSAGGVAANNIAMWNGSKWSAIGNGLNGPVYALAYFDSNLYAGGDFISPNGIAEFTKNSLGIKQLTNNISARVFPNPNSGNFTITLNHAEPGTIADIYNVLGEKVYSQKLNTQTTQINLSGEAKGIYFYRIHTSDSKPVNSGKLVIE